MDAAGTCITGTRREGLEYELAGLVVDKLDSCVQLGQKATGRPADKPDLTPAPRDEPQRAPLGGGVLIP